MNEFFKEQFEKLTDRDVSGSNDLSEDCRPNMQCTPADGDCDPGNDLYDGMKQEKRP